jgi:uncharacterized protein RhaS with RHS repeats
MYDDGADPIYNYFRDYDPGRYIEPDPMGIAAGSASLFAYSNANPTSFVDPFGLLPDVGKFLWEFVFPKPWSAQRCKALKETIDNQSKDLEKRFAEIRLNPKQLPQWGPMSGSGNYESINGHWREINRIDSQRRTNEKAYDKYCNDGCPPSAPATNPTSTPADLATPTAGSLFITILGGVLIFL